MKAKNLDPETSLRLFNELDGATRALDAAAVARALSSGANPNHRPAHGGETPLMVAAQESAPEIVKLLLDAGARPNAARAVGAEKRSALLMAMEPNSARAGEVVELLVRAGAKPWKKSRGSRSAIDAAIIPARPWALEALLRAGVGLDDPEPGGGPSIAERLCFQKMPSLLARLRAREIDLALEPRAEGAIPSRPKRM